jgi:ATP-dependent helicase/nuclease subunit B
MISERSFAGEKKLILLVPEQNSFENERALLKLIGAKCAQNVKILTFTSMTNLIFSQLRKNQGNRLDNSGRNIMMYLAMQHVKDQMCIYKSLCDKREVTSLMVDTLKNFKTNSIDGKTLIEKSAMVENQILQRKMKEVGLIFTAFDSLISATYLDPLDDLTKLYNLLLDHSFFEEYTIFIDEFDLFTAQQLKVLELIISQTKDCYITLCAPKPSKESELFSCVYKTMENLILIAKRNQVAVSDPIALEYPHRFYNSSLKTLEQNIFQEQNSPKNFSKHKENFNDNQFKSDFSESDINIYKGLDIQDECDFIARNIRKLVIDEGYHYCDFVVLARNMESYEGVIDLIFKKYQIPFFMDMRENIHMKPLMRLVLSAFNIVHTNFSSDSIFEYVKTGLLGLKTEEISLLENYAFVWQIQNEDWTRPFLKNPVGFSEKFRECEKNNLNIINSIREKIIAPILEFSKAIKATSSYAISSALYDLLLKLNVQKNLREMAAILRAEWETNLAQEQVRLWDILISILDQIVMLLGDKKTSSQIYAEILQLAIESSDIAFIPQGLDEVKIGTIDRVRPEKPKIVFVIGAIFGEFPKIPDIYGIFDKKDCTEIASIGVPFKDSLEDILLRERFFAYKALTYASRKLFISWHRMDFKGKAKFASNILDEIKNIFPNVKLIASEHEESIDKVWAKSPGFEACAAHWNKNSVFSESLKHYFKSDKDYKKMTNHLEKICLNNEIKFKNPENAKNLFHFPMVFSATQIEQYHLCKFRYFCKYGLNAKQRKLAKFDSLEYGNFMHFLLENILKENSPENLLLMDKSVLRLKISQLIQKYSKLRWGEGKEPSKRIKHLLLKIKKISCDLVIHIAQELSQSEFSSKDYELSLSHNGKIAPLIVDVDELGTVEVRGKIDRIDIMNKNGKSYVRIIDYKTGKTEFRLSDILYGLNMQMLIYLLTVIENGSKVYGDTIPAGILYMPAIIPILNLAKISNDDTIKKERQKKMRMNGIILSDTEVIYGMEKDAKGLFIPASIKNGQLVSSSFVVSLSDIKALMSQPKKLIATMAKDLYNGKINIEPLKGEFDVCSFCEYTAVCHYQEKKNDKKKCEFNPFIIPD